MSRIICIADARVKPTRKTPRPASRFGAGIMPFTPFVGHMPFTLADVAWAAQAFGESSPDYDLAAGEATAVDALSRGIFLG